MQSKVRLFNTSQVWNPKKRYKINETVTYGGNIYQNSTGINSDPTLGINWEFIKRVDATPMIYKNDFIDSGTHTFNVPLGVLAHNVFLNFVAAASIDWSQTGQVVTVTSAVSGDLVTITGSN